MVKNLLSLLTARQKNILSGATIIMVMTVLAKILGLVKARLLVHFFTPDSVAVFIAAFKIPDIIFQVFIFGAILVSFIPVFTEYLEQKGEKEAFKLVSSTLNISALVFIFFCTLIYIFTDFLTSLIVPGFSNAEKIQVASLTRIIIFGQIFLILGSIFIGVSQSFQRFIIPALAGFFYNLGIILGIYFLAKPFGLMGAAYGVIFGAVLLMVIQLPLVFQLGFRHKFFASFFHPGVIEIIKLTGIRSLGLAAEQINEVVGITLASLISTSSVTYLTFAQYLQIVPVGLFGAAIAQAALPVLSLEAARKRMYEYKTTLFTTLQQILFLVLPAAAILIALRLPVVRLVYGSSQFDWISTIQTYKTLSFLALGIPANAVILLLVRGFYALKDTKTPVLISFVTVIINIALSIMVVFFFPGVENLALIYSISAILSATLLFYFLIKKIGDVNIKEILSPVLKMTMAAVIMGVSLYIPLKLFDRYIVDTTRTLNLLMLTSLVTFFGLVIYLLLVWFLRVKELQTYVDLIKKIGGFQARLKPEEIIHTEGQPL